MERQCQFVSMKMGQIGGGNIGPLCPLSYVSLEFIVFLDRPSRRRPFQEFFPNLTVAPRCYHWNSLHRDRFVVYGMVPEENEYAYINDLWEVSLPRSPNLGLSPRWIIQNSSIFMFFSLPLLPTFQLYKGRTPDNLVGWWNLMNCREVTKESGKSIFSSAV